jgi:hypothetical protein
MAGACSFDESQLRPAPTSTPDGAIEHPVVLDAGASGDDGAIAILPDAITGTGGGGAGETGGSGDVSVDAAVATGDGNTSLGDSATPSDLGAVRDVTISLDAAPTPDTGAEALPAVDATFIPDVTSSRDVPFIPDVSSAPDTPTSIPDAASIPDAPTVSTAELLLYYSCDQVNGTSLPDLSGNGNNGTLVGPVSIGPGKVGNALVFTATNNADAAASGGYVAIPPALLSASPAITIATWFKVNSTLGYQRIFDIGTSQTSGMYLMPNYSKTGYLHFTFRMDPNRDDIDATGTAIPAGVWEHVTLVLDSSGGRLYLNGVQVGATTAMTMLPPDLGATPNNWIGRSEFPENPYLDGAIDEFRVYNRALSAGEILALVGTGTGSPGSGDGGATDGPAGTDSSPTLCSPVPKSTGGIACPGGKCTVGPYSGSASTFSDGVSSTICLSGNTLCAAGTTNASKSTNTTINWGTAFDFNLSPNSTDTDLVGVQLSGSGIFVTLSSLPTGAQARVQVMVGNAAYYCAAMSASSQTLPWASFNTACWNNSGTYLSGAPTAATSIAIVVSSEAGVAGSFDLCVTSLAFPGSETCPTGYHDDGTGTCVLIGACSAGYHDGGEGTCVASGTCSAGYHSGGTGTCVASGTCLAGYHDGGTGTCVVSGTCSAGYHNGGGGACVASGTCSAGYNNCSGTCSSSSCGGGLGADCSIQPCASGLTCRTNIYGGRVCSSG